jgi:putative salt-induced outer membrane protein
MKNTLAILALSFLALSSLAPSAFAADAPAANAGLHNESSVGVVIVGGNSDSQTFDFKQLNTYGWDLNLLKLTGHYLKTSTASIDTAQNWSIGLRYERELADRFSLFASEALESDAFAGFLQRYNTDAGGKYFIFKETDFTWTVEAGYRYAVENRFDGQVNQSLLRFYTEAVRDWTKTLSAKISIEELTNLTISSDYQINGEASVSASITEIFAIKTGYGLKYRKIPVAPATHTTDTQFTTALVAKF